MEIFQTIWTALSTPNPTLIQIFGIPLTIIEQTVTMLLFLTLLNIPATRKQKISYVLVMFLISFISNTFIPKPLGPILHVFIIPLFIKFFFKTSILKGIVAEFLPMIIIVLLETIIGKLYYLLSGLPYEVMVTIPIYRESLVILIYLIIYILYRLAKHFNFNITLIENMNLKTRLLLLFALVVGMIAIGSQFYLIKYYNDNLPFFIVLLSLLSLTTYFLISLFGIMNTTKLAIMNQDLEQTRLYNNTLQILHDNMRAFKHDFANIVQSIGRICR